jgi:hypothetical protein
MGDIRKKYSECRIPLRLLRLFQSVILTFVLTYITFLTWTGKLDSLLFVFSLNFAAMIWSLVLLKIHKPSLNSRWYNSIALEQNGRIYKGLGVLTFQAVLRLIGWHKVSDSPKVQRDIKVLELLEKETRLSEAGHLMCLAIVSVFICIGIINLNWVGLMYLLISAMLFHLYPIMLQRHHRPRIRRAIDSLYKRGANH